MCWEGYKYKAPAVLPPSPVEGFAASEPLAESVSGPSRVGLWARLKLLFRTRFS